jgi:ATP-dependent Clp protease ATP-binding subunit ClpC
MPDLIFSERTRRTLARAREEAVGLNHEYVSTEHMLLALLRDIEGVAAEVLKTFSVDARKTRQVVLRIVKKGTSALPNGTELPYTSRGKKTLDLAMAQAREWDHSYVGAEHLLIGLLREKQGIGAQILANAGVTVDAARAHTLSILGEQPKHKSWRTTLKRIFS